MMDLQSLLSLGCRTASTVGIGGLQVRMMEATTAKLREENCRVSIKNYDDPGLLVRDLIDHKIDAAVRGAMGSLEILKELKRQFNLKEVRRTAVLENANGKQFLLTPVGIDEGRSVAARIALVKDTVAYFSSVGWKLSIGVLSKGRTEDSSRGRDIRKSLSEGEGMAKALLSQGIPAKHFSILLEEAVRESDLVVAPDGVTGNLIFRSMHFVGGGRAYGAPVVNMPEAFVDTSRSKADFVDAVLLAAGLAAAQHDAKTSP
jgi:putative methanogen marker protein 4